MNDKPSAAAERRIFIARHGSRLDDENPDWARQSRRPWDPPLAPRGRDQAGRLAARLGDSGVNFIFSSPFLRALETAEPLADILDLPLQVEPGLIDTDPAILKKGALAVPPPSCIAEIVLTGGKWRLLGIGNFLEPHLDIQ